MIRSKTSDNKKRQPSSGNILDLFREANQRLASSPLLTQGHSNTSLADFPLYILAGSAEAGKTSTFLAAGLSPELLAGQVHREAAIVPTSTCNLWYAFGSIFAEIGGRLYEEDPEQWRMLLRRLCDTQQSMLISRLRGRWQVKPTLRGLVWFCDISPFLGVPDPAHINELARQTQEQLLILGETLGSNFPVSVVFTKSDQLPHFADFVYRMTDEEDRQVFGCTLPASNLPGTGDVYADAQTRRLLEPFNQLYRSLADKRLKMLAREPEGVRKPGIYEFPREVKRIRDPLIHFLVEAFRPNPLQPGPLLRGFYFTAVRQVPAKCAPGAAASVEHAGRPKNLDATILFQTGAFSKPDTNAAAPSSTAVEGTVPQWTFVAQPFQKVILLDKLGQVAGARNTRNELKKRILLISASAASILLTFCITYSAWSNWALLSQAQKAAQANFSQITPSAALSVSDLRNLEQLRQVTAPLIEFRRTGAPWHLRWGLYSGGRIMQRAYDAYFQLFQHYFLSGAENTITQKLARLQAAHGSVPYNDAYDTLKVYRMMTSGRCSPDSAFLVPVFQQNWQIGRALPPDSSPLVEQQVRFYAAELTRKNPYAVDENPALVEHARSYLSSFGGVDRLFRGMIEEANKLSRQSVRIADIAPDYREVLSAPGEVQVAFTREGWRYMQAAIHEPDHQSVGESCVVGDTSAQPSGTLDRTQVASQLTNLYTRAYIQTWKDFLRATQVQPFRSVSQAAHNLEILADNRSPLLAVLYLISENTKFPKPTQSSGSAPASSNGGLLNRILAVSVKKTASPKSDAGIATVDPSADIARIFQPVQEVMPAGNRDRLIDDPNRNYVDALSTLQQAMQRLQNDSPSNPDLALHQQAEHAVEAGMDAVRQIAQRFNIAGAEGVDVQLKRLLESPFRYSMLFIITDPSKAGKDQLTAAMKSLCAGLTPLQHKFPFNPQSDIDATADEVAAVFAPPSGSLFTFEQQITKMITRQGKTWVQNGETSEPRLSPAFFQFLNRLTVISETLFPDGSPQMRLRYGLRALPGSEVESISLEIDGSNLVVAPGQSQAKLFNWPGPPGAQQVLIRVKAGANIPFASYDGAWGIFHMAADADPRVPGSRAIELSKVRRGHGRPESILDSNDKPIQVHLEVTDLPGGVDIFDKNFFDVRCPAKILQ